MFVYEWDFVFFSLMNDQWYHEIMKSQYCTVDNTVKRKNCIKCVDCITHYVYILKHFAFFWDFILFCKYMELLYFAASSRSNSHNAHKMLTCFNWCNELLWWLCSIFLRYVGNNDIFILWTYRCLLLDREWSTQVVATLFLFSLTLVFWTKPRLVTFSLV